MRIDPIPGPIGAIVRDLDLRADLGDEEKNTLWTGFQPHLVCQRHRRRALGARYRNQYVHFVRFGADGLVAHWRMRIRCLAGPAPQPPRSVPHRPRPARRSPRRRRRKSQEPPGSVRRRLVSVPTTPPGCR